MPTLAAVAFSAVRCSVRAIRARQAEAASNVVEDVDGIVHTTKGLLAGSHGEDGHVRQRVHALVGASGESAVGDEAVDIVLRVGEVVIGFEAGDVCGWETWSALYARVSDVFYIDSIF